MKTLGRVIIWLVVALVLVLFFLPKKALFFEGEKLLKPQHIILSGERVGDTGFGLNVSGGTLYYEDLKVAQLNAVTVTPWVLYNRISIAPFRLSPAMKSFLPGTIDAVTVSYTVLDPLHIVVEASGSFGALSGVIGLQDRQIRFDLSPSRQLLTMQPFWLKQLHKTEEGVYRYESTY
jgi:hypothetical protein